MIQYPKVRVHNVHKIQQFDWTVTDLRRQDQVEFKALLEDPLCMRETSLIDVGKNYEAVMLRQLGKGGDGVRKYRPFGYRVAKC